MYPAAHAAAPPQRLNPLNPQRLLLACALQPWPGMNVRADFDRIAALSPSHTLTREERWLLARAPPRIERALEVGCGLGVFTRALASRARSVDAIDLSPGMIERARGGAAPHMTFQVADALAVTVPEGHFDCIASLATLHHLPLAPMLARMAGWLRPGGVLLVQDLDDWHGLHQLPRNALAWLASRPWARKPQDPALAVAWDDHCRNETYPTIAEVRAASARAAGCPGGAAPAVAGLAGLAEAGAGRTVIYDKLLSWHSRRSPFGLKLRGS